MTRKRKFSLFISSTYEDLMDERQALIDVALENGFIPVLSDGTLWEVVTANCFRQFPLPDRAV